MRGLQSRTSEAQWRGLTATMDNDATEEPPLAHQAITRNQDWGGFCPDTPLAACLLSKRLAVLDVYV
jgi:hypothetical protein